MTCTSALRHIVLCDFLDAITPAKHAELIYEFSQLKHRIPGVRQFEWGANVSPEGLDDGYTDCFTLTFEGPAARDAYLTHPAHLAFVELLKPWLGRVLVVDYIAQENPG
ncbi:MULTISPECIES: Dabb family protein [unclassified Janthinobacterium]|uniref:Dabb family protein n=1 Tax=unclassified Janthinobacterium TaxID=2610881 RepID=UPI0008F4C180|nr:MULTISPECIES: Dabb family protein [unclassified Janthinobacterium]MDN2709084.1 Dabb family protein [Janthinobacterium sp. SUN118]